MKMNLKKIETSSVDGINGYASQMSAYYLQLKREQKSGKRLQELEYLSSLLDRCAKLPSPHREQLFLDSILARDAAESQHSARAA